LSETILQVEGLEAYFPVREGLIFEREVGTVRAVDGVSFSLKQGDILGLVGESGCGKTTLSRAILRLIPPTGGRVVLNGQDLGTLSRSELRAMRPDAQIIFQDPYASLNPRMTVFDAIAEPLLTHRRAEKASVNHDVAVLMEKVGLSPHYMKKYPHEFSGGQRQRIAIARTLALKPKLIIADEPVSALDVSVQAQILNLIAALCKTENLTLIFISHDLAVVRHVAQRIAVMYLGKIVEQGNAEEVFKNPLHPYTQALISAAPLPDPIRERNRKRNLLQGDPPSPLNPPPGCSFHPRCPVAEARCSRSVPVMKPDGAEHQATCLLI
jgi:oligopeptide/dipeptide ABC transporter ATP-binding protein